MQQKNNNHINNGTQKQASWPFCVFEGLKMCNKNTVEGLTCKNWLATFTDAICLFIFQALRPAYMHNYIFFKFYCPGIFPPSQTPCHFWKLVQHCESQLFMLFSYFCFFFTHRVNLCWPLRETEETVSTGGGPIWAFF